MAIDMKSGKGILVIVLIAFLAALLGGVGVYALQKRAADTAAEQAAAAAAAAAKTASVTPTTPPVTQPPASGGQSGGGTQAGGSGTQGGQSSGSKEEPPASSGSTGINETSYAIIKKMTDSGESNYKITSDYVQFLTGKEAAAAWKADGNPGDLDGDFYIRNQNTKLRTYPVAADAKLYILDPPGDPAAKKKVGPDVFQSMVTNQAEYKDALYKITVKNSKITLVEHIFMP